MICLKCKKQIPDDSVSCPYCGNKTIAEVQVGEEIKYRRYQRWFLYIIIIAVFLGMLALIIKIYSVNNKYVQTNLQIKKSAEEKQAQLEGDLTKKEALVKEIQSTLANKEKETQEMDANLKKAQDELSAKTDEFKKILDEKSAIANQKGECELNLNSADANIYNLIIKLGRGVSNNDLWKIPVANANFSGQDTDGDGLSDDIELSLKTNPNKADSDGDGYNDKDEILRGFNPNGLGKINYDYKFAAANKGKILLQVESKGQAWYIGATDGKRYFLGTPSDAFRVMRDLDYWTKGWKAEPKVLDETTQTNNAVVAPAQPSSDTSNSATTSASQTANISVPASGGVLGGDNK